MADETTRRLFTEEGVKELERRATSSGHLGFRDYEQLAMAAFSEMMALDAERQGKPRSVVHRPLNYGHPVFTKCWNRLKEDLLLGNKDAFSGTQMALQYAKKTGLLDNPRWGGPRKREVERIFQQASWDPWAPPGMKVDPSKVKGTKRLGSLVAPDAREAIDGLPIGAKLGIADVWVALGDDDKEAINAQLKAAKTEREKVEILKTLAGKGYTARDGNKDIPEGYPGWVEDLPPGFEAELRKLPKRSQAILEHRYSINNNEQLFKHINLETAERRRTPTGKRTLELVTRFVCPRGDAAGALAGAELRLDQGKSSFLGYLAVRERLVPKFDAAERQLAVQHAKEQAAQVHARGRRVVSTPKAVDGTYRKVFDRAAALIRELSKPFLDSLEEMGLGSRRGRHFQAGLKDVVERLMFKPLDAPPLNQIKRSGDVRRQLFEEFFLGLGVPKDTAGRYAKTLAATRKQYRDDRTRLPYNASFTDYTPWQIHINTWFPLINANARKTYKRLKDIHAAAAEPYKGTGKDRSGIDQVVDLLKRFPDIAQYVFKEAGMIRLDGFPPKANFLASPAEKAFAKAFEEELDRDWWEGVLFTAGLAVIAIALTLLSAGTMSPAAAAIVGVALGGVQGGVMVANAQSAASEGRVATMIGAMSPETLRRLENDLKGAWAMLAVDMLSGGILAKFGGATLAKQVVRGTVINAAGAGIGTAMNPNVWESKDRVGIIFQATLIGGAAGGGGAALGGALGAAFKRGAKVQIAIEAEGGPLTVGRAVKVSTGPKAEPIPGTVTAIDQATGSMVVRAGGVEFNVRVDKAIAIAADVPPTSSNGRKVSLQHRAIVHRPRVMKDPAPFAPLRALEAQHLGNAAQLRSLGAQKVLSASQKLMPEVQKKLAALGYKTTMVRVPNELGGEHFALRIDHAPGRFGTAMRRVKPIVDKDLRFMYDPVGTTLEGASGLYDPDLRSVRLGHSVMANAHEGVVGPVFHEIRHNRTSRFVRLGKTDYPYQGAFIFDENVKPLNLDHGYREYFQVDEVLTYHRQSGSSLRETRRAIALVDRKGLVALDDPRTKLFFEKGAQIASGESVSARGFARVVKENADDMLKHIDAHGATATSKPVTDGSYPGTAYWLEDKAGRKLLRIEYWTDTDGAANAMVSAGKLDSAGQLVEQSERSLHLIMREAPPGYKGDASHKYIRARLERMKAASKEVIERALLIEKKISKSDDMRRMIFKRLAQ